jgi:hypothetical protein
MGWFEFVADYSRFSFLKRFFDFEIAEVKDISHEVVRG